MNPIKKNIPFSNVLFPFLMTFKDQKMPENELPDHIHDWHEIIYVYDGTGTFFIDKSFHTMEKGNFFFIPRNTIHRAMPDISNPVTSTAVFFSKFVLGTESFGDYMTVRGVMEEWEKKRGYKILLSSEQQHFVEEKLDTIQRGILNQDFGYRQSIVLELQIILLQLCQSVFKCGADGSGTSGITGSPGLELALQYIDTHLTETIYLNDLSPLANMSPPYFSRVFKQMIGLTLTEYITTKRIVRAKEYLEKTDEKIFLVAENCGFTSLPHFHRTFLKYAGLTPGSYRKIKH
ncbi:AraC family transcriptional regulator [Alicyclobacillus fodiniaquatilis]|uniref:Helix-turn-helix domain-containing protein n=1 Tax=Alicyclobacillus fodiniaquatilis TaxID=1661150 RepID=A0ABW4JCL9_9BACL